MGDAGDVSRAPAALAALESRLAELHPDLVALTRKQPKPRSRARRPAARAQAPRARKKAARKR
jgi:hypothetical protein